MQVNELIERLVKFPPHYEVAVFLARNNRKRRGEMNDLRQDVCGVSNIHNEKIVLIEIPARLLPD